MRTVVCVDDAEEDLQALEYQFSDYYRVIPCRDAASALAIISKVHPAAVVLDLEMPGYDGFQVLSDIRKLDVAPPVLMLSGHTEPLFIVRALHEGAGDYIAKPYNFSLLRRRVDLMVANSGYNPTSENVNPPNIESPHIQNQAVTKEIQTLLVGSSNQMRCIREEICRYSSAALPVLIQGESGTGKDLAARALHMVSPRSSGPFQVLNIAAIPPGLVEGELFGCESGAFTDARPRKGCFELANGGTLFLDEIGDAGYTVQTSLLRIVEDMLVRRLGGNTYHQVDCRIVFATNKNLDDLIKQGKFRMDLKYRIEGLSIHIPPLREHKEDIPELVTHFLNCGSHEKNSPEYITQEALDLLFNYDWPGNVRQLRSCIARSALLAGHGRIDTKHIRL